MAVRGKEGTEVFLTSPSKSKGSTTKQLSVTVRSWAERRGENEGKRKQRELKVREGKRKTCCTENGKDIKKHKSQREEKLHHTSL